MKNKKKRAEAVALILAGESNASTQSQRLNVDKRTVERWVAAARKAAGAPPVAATTAVPQNAPPPQETPSDAPNPAVEAARAGAGLGPDPAAPPVPTAADVAAGVEDGIKFCLDTVGNLKQAVGGMLVTFRYSPPLSLTDKEVQELLALTPLTTAAIRANWQTLYPQLLKWMNGPFQVFGALALEAVLLFIGLSSKAEARGWKPPEKKEDDRQAREENFARQLDEGHRAAVARSQAPSQPSPDLPEHVRATMGSAPRSPEAAAA